MKTSLHKAITAALFAALACVATMSIRIPTPGTGGYIHPGDAIVILSGIILGPAYGFLAAGIGSAMADLLGGYGFYVPITFAIKGAVAIVSALLYRRVGTTSARRSLAVALSGLAAIVIVAGGYFLSGTLFYGRAAALVSLPANLIQGTGGMVFAMLLYPILFAIPDVRTMTTQSRSAVH